MFFFVKYFVNIQRISSIDIHSKSKNIRPSDIFVRNLSPRINQRMLIRTGQLLESVATDSLPTEPINSAGTIGVHSWRENYLDRQSISAGNLSRCLPTDDGARLVAISPPPPARLPALLSPPDSQHQTDGRRRRISRFSSSTPLLKIYLM